MDHDVIFGCAAGVSRSSYATCATLMATMHVGFDEALATIRKGRPVANPNQGFVDQLRGMELQLRALLHRAFVPFVYMNFVAVRKAHQNQKIGTLLLGNALSRCGQIVRNVGVYGMALHALTERAASLYERYGFCPYGESKYPFMILPTQTLIDLTAGEPDRFP